MPARIGRSLTRSAISRIPFRHSPVRPSPTSGTRSASASSSSWMIGAVTVGTSSALYLTGLPNASASTERSIRLKTAAISNFFATASIQSACSVPFPTISSTVFPVIWIPGNDSTGRGFFTSARIISCIHFFISKSMVIPLYCSFF